MTPAAAHRSDKPLEAGWRDICAALSVEKTAGSRSDCNIVAAAAILRVLANDDRIGVLFSLAEQGEVRFGDLRQRFGFSQTKMSQILSRLRHERLVDVRRDGHAAYYRLGSREARIMVERMFTLFEPARA